MRIGIDANPMYPKASGIGRYLLEIIKAMSKMPEASEHEFILYPGKNTVRLELPSNWTFSERKITSRGFLRAIFYPNFIKKDCLDLFYSCDYLSPIRPMPCSTVITIHDIIPIIQSQFVSLKHHIIAKYFFPFSIKYADSIISVSEFTRQDLLKYMDVNADKIKVIHLGKNSFFKPVKDQKIRKKVLQKYKICDEPYILFLGYLDPRKNLSNLLKSFSIIDKSIRKNYRIVLAGNIDSNDENLKNILQELNLEERIIITGFIEDSDLAVLFSCSRVFCFPSLYEGFGLPVLEAMACGCPVITSNISSLPEVVGDAAILVDPYNIEQIRDAIIRVINDNELISDLKKKGLKQADKYSWEKTAKQIFEIFMNTGEKNNTVSKFSQN